jgi:hypothetical protein
MLALELPIPEIKNTFTATYSVFIKNAQTPAKYKLYNSWTLGNTLNIHVYNDLGRNKLGCVLGSHGLGSHLVVPPTGNLPIRLGNRSQPNWDEGPT